MARRRRFTIEQKLAVVAAKMQPGMSISYVARRHGLSPSLVFRWRRLMTGRRPGAVAIVEYFIDPIMAASIGEGSLFMPPSLFAGAKVLAMRTAALLGRMQL